MSSYNIDRQCYPPLISPKIMGHNHNIGFSLIPETEKNNALSLQENCNSIYLPSHITRSMKHCTPCPKAYAFMPMWEKKPIAKSTKDSNYSPPITKDDLRNMFILNGVWGMVGTGALALTATMISKIRSKPQPKPLFDHILNRNFLPKEITPDLTHNLSAFIGGIAIIIGALGVRNYLQSDSNSELQSYIDILNKDIHNK